MNKKILIFDLDDTLIDDSYKFEIGFCDCIKTVITAMEGRSPQIDEILQKARDLDNEKLATWPDKDKYLPKRVGMSWIETYEYFSRLKDVPVKSHIRRLLWSQVMMIWDPPYIVMPGVIETLIKLRERGYTLHVLTIGHPAIQTRKLKLTELAKFFDKAHVESSNKEGKLKELSDKYGRENIVMIGNSIRSDINPALNIGLESVYIPRGSWHAFIAEPVNDKYVTVNKIQEVLNLFK